MILAIWWWGSSIVRALGMRSTPSLPLLPDPLRLGVVAPDRVLCMSQIELFDTSSECKQMTYEVHAISFQTFFVWALLLVVHTWNSSPLQSNFLQLQCTCCTVPTTSGRTHGSPLVWACQWPSSQPLSSPQLSHNNSLWA